MTKYKNFKTRPLVVFLAVFMSAALLLTAVGYAGGGRREVRVEYRFVMEQIPPSSAKVRVWVPLPSRLPGQSIKAVSVDAPVPYEIMREDVWSNSLVYFEMDGREAAPLVFSMSFIVERRELRGLEKKGSRLSVIKGNLLKYLRPSRLGPHTDVVRTLADKAAADGAGDVQKARHIYDYVLKNMDYNKKKPGWGRGDVGRLCLAIAGGEKGTGNCTDFHSFFAALLQTQQIPVLFEMGYPLKPGKGSSEGGYHCWASFYTEDNGWVPVDISEADKAPERADYYFGSIDENRVTFSRGRDVILNPRQQGEPLNYFGPDPYIEVDAVPFKGFKRTITYKDVR